MNHTEQIELPQVKKAGLHRRLYEWTLHWAHTPYGSIALFALAFCESSFFPDTTGCTPDGACIFTTKNLSNMQQFVQ